MINVTKTYLPDFDKYTSVLRRAWDKAWITNNGELVQELEKKLKDYLGVKHLFFCNNGTIVLQMALKAFHITKEVITTPFSYIATSNAILWENCTPVFVDIDKNSFCIDADKIEKAITDNTQAILATHVYGIPCNVYKIEQIARKHKLKIIYDGAHAFGCVYKDKPLLSYGDISTCSFHATKIFHTVEGGCIITNDDDIANKLLLFRQFGHIGDNYYSIGLNGKNSEFHAAMGLVNLDEINNIIQSRKTASEYYDLNLNSKVQKLNKESDFTYNYSYYPVLFESEQILMKVFNHLKENEILCRRYFYPSLDTLNFLSKNPSCPISNDIAVRVLCLPLYYNMERNILDKIISTINSLIE